MTNLVELLKAPPRADAAAGQRPAGAGNEGRSNDHRSGGSLSRGYGRGLTLIEMLVALAVTLVMMAAVVNLFANMSASIRNRRAAIETGAQLRQTRNRLAMDLSGATCRGSTWQDPAENQGYIEIVEGEWSDKNPSELTDGNTGNGELDYTTSLVPSSQAFDPDTGAIPGGGNIGAGAVTDGRALGDWDDVLALTVRSESDPFILTDDMGTPGNRNDDVIVESPLAEVVWFAEEKGLSTPPDPNDGMRKIHRRVRLIAPWRGPWAGEPNNISAHFDPSLGQWVANTLGDLTKRENRITRDNASAFPFPLRRGRLLPNNDIELDSRVLNNALAFDLRVFDPGAPLFQAGNVVLEPSDLGYAASPIPDGFGAYVDLGWGANPGSTNLVWPAGANFSDPLLNLPPNMPAPQFHVRHQAGWHPREFANTSFTGSPAVYDTWSYHYENDGLNQDQSHTATPYNTVFDQGANGLDDDNANGVDDRGERETAPPYDVPLRGVKVILRVYEPDARQIRESSVTHSFKQ